MNALGALVRTGDRDRLRIAYDQAVSVGYAGVARPGRVELAGAVIERRLAVDQIDAPFDPCLVRGHLADQLQRPGRVLLEAEHPEPRRLPLDAALLLVAGDRGLRAVGGDFDPGRPGSLRADKERVRVIADPGDPDGRMDLVDCCHGFPLFRCARFRLAPHRPCGS